MAFGRSWAMRMNMPYLVPERKSIIPIDPNVQRDGLLLETGCWPLNSSIPGWHIPDLNGS
jgi:hypothetical protein